MKIPYGWLREFVPTELPASQAAEKLTMGGLSVSSVKPFSSKQDGIVVGNVLSVRKHPNADRLSLCSVEAGGEVYDVVCGAPNVRPGMKAPFAIPGSRLPNGRTIEPAAIRGVTSRGMLCSPAEIGAGPDADGIMELPASSLSGEPFVPEPEDWVLDLEITPNRGDALSVLGVARQLAAVLGVELKMPWALEREAEAESGGGWSVSIEDPEACGIYTARLIEGIKVAPSPDWMQSRLLACGLRPINNVVDITNYVLMETGHPLHSFDARKIGGRKIVVRRARNGEKMKTLDGVERKLNGEVLVISDEKDAAAIAGVMGGAGSEITESTKDVLLEAAWFDPIRIRRGARSLGMATESSFRFERGVDPEGVVPASIRATKLIAEISEARPSDVLLGTRGRLPKAAPVRVNFSQARSWLGVDMEPKTIERYCGLIGAKIAGRNGADEVDVIRPSWRFDLEKPADYYEEFAILHGYDRIPSTMPVLRASSLPASSAAKIEATVSEALRASGFSEVMNMSFMHRTDFELLGLDDDGGKDERAALVNPMSEDQEYMRSTLLPGIMRSAAFNLARDSAGAMLFEVGAVFRRTAGILREWKSLALIASGTVRKDLHYAQRAADISDVKGALENVSRAVGVEIVTEAGAGPFFVKGSCAWLKAQGAIVGIAGVLKPAIAEAFGIPFGAAAAELDLETLEGKAGGEVQVAAPPRYPSVNLDLALVVGDGVEAGSLESVIRKSGGPLLESAEVFDVYRGRQTGKGSKSVAFRLSFRSPERTLTEEEAAEAFRRIVETVEKECGAKLRSA